MFSAWQRSLSRIRPRLLSVCFSEGLRIFAISHNISWLNWIIIHKFTITPGERIKSCKLGEFDNNTGGQWFRWQDLNSLDLIISIFDHSTGKLRFETCTHHHHGSRAFWHSVVARRGVCILSASACSLYMHCMCYCLVLGLKVNQPTMLLLYRCTQGRGCVKCTMKYFIEKIIAHFKTGDIEWEFLSLWNQNLKSDFEECLRMITSHPVLSKEKHLLAYWQVCYFSFCFHRWVKYHREQKRMASCKWKYILLDFS